MSFQYVRIHNATTSPKAMVDSTASGLAVGGIGGNGIGGTRFSGNGFGSIESGGIKRFGSGDIEFDGISNIKRTINESRLIEKR